MDLQSNQSFGNLYLDLLHPVSSHCSVLYFLCMSRVRLIFLLINTFYSNPRSGLKQKLFLFGFRNYVSKTPLNQQENILNFSFLFRCQSKFHVELRGRQTTRRVFVCSTKESRRVRVCYTSRVLSKCGLNFYLHVSTPVRSLEGRILSRVTRTDLNFFYVLFREVLDFPKLSLFLFSS